MNWHTHTQRVADGCSQNIKQNKTEKIFKQPTQFEDIKGLEIHHHQQKTTTEKKKARKT